ncbi:MAG: hypothetical protein ACXADB_00505 [Candidatus Hermodarchaeia archaeon]|jgi:hypothetical protein
MISVKTDLTKADILGKDDSQIYFMVDEPWKILTEPKRGWWWFYTKDTAPQELKDRHASIEAEVARLKAL